jgi:hypothetical protein
VTNQVDDTIDRINDEGKGIDILVNNVVFSLIGVLEDLSRDEIKAEFETRSVRCHHSNEDSAAYYEKTARRNNGSDFDRTRLNYPLH